MYTQKLLKGSLSLFIKAKQTLAATGDRFPCSGLCPDDKMVVKSFHSHVTIRSILMVDNDTPKIANVTLVCMQLFMSIAVSGEKVAM